MKHTIHRALAASLTVILLLSAVACGADEQGGLIGPVPETSATRETAAAIPQETPADTAQETEPVPVATVPDFTVLDGDGNEVKLSELFGKPIVLNFWATWCPPCKAEMPDLQKAYETYGEDIRFVMVNLTDGSRDTVDGVKQFIEDNGYTFPVYFDTQYSAAMAYSVSSIPTTYFISPEGTLLQSKVGMLTEAEIEAAMQLLTESNS